MVIIILAPIFLIFLSKFDNVLSKLIPYLLILSTIFLISKESQKINAIIVLLISGFLGIAVLNSNLNQPFLPLLSGLFGSSSIILSLKSKTKIPQQKNKKIKIKKKGLIKPVLASAFASPFCTLLPGIGSGQAAIIGTSIIKPTKKNFLILLGATNTIVVGLSFIVFYAIGKTRTGVAAVISEITGNLNTNLITTILVTILITGIISFYWTLFLARQISNKINKLNYSYLSIFILIIISLIVFIFTGFFGIFIFLISTATGIYGILSGAKRINLMGCLILPVLLWYLI